MNRNLLASSLALLLIAIGCSNSSTPPTQGSTVTIPNVGTYWTYQDTHLDTNGVSIKTDTNIRKIATTGVTYGGYSDVVMTLETTANPNVFDTTYVRYLASGDIMRSSAPAVDPSSPHWYNVGYVSRTPFSVDFGGAISLDGFTYDTVSFSNSFLDSTNVLVGGTSYKAYVISSITWDKISSPTKDSTYQISQSTSFIPSIGVFGDHDVSAYTIDGKKLQRRQQKLIAIHLN